MNNTLFRLTSIIALGAHLLLNCVIMPLHSHGLSCGSDEIHYTRSTEDRTHHSIMSNHHGECTVCQTYRDLSSELPMFSIIQQDMIVVSIHAVTVQFQFSAERSSTTLRGPPQILS
jgi:hypothetical protein